jgi:4-diphosphocytidyl-2-C-methyl-D-erythritol kinase
VLGLERGDLLFPLIDPPRAWVVLVLPKFGISTKDAFGWLDQDRGTGPVRADRATSRQTEMLNDLEAPVVARHREVGRIIAALRRVGATRSAMSGSGSAVFGLFSSKESAFTASHRLASASRRTLLTRTLTRRTYQLLAAT